MLDPLPDCLATLETGLEGGRALAFGMPGGTEWIILLVLGLLIFGRRLPEVGRSLGRGIVEFKKGIKGIDDEIEEASSSAKLPESTPSARLADSTESRPVTNAATAATAATPSEKPSGG